MAARDILTELDRRPLDTPLPASGTTACAPGFVLVVDDDEDTRHLITRWLAHANIAFMEASSGEEAMDLADRYAESIEAVVSDVMMDGMDGFELVRRLRAASDTAHIPVVMMTGTATHESDVVRGVETGAVDYLAKPVSPHVVVAKLKALSERHRVERQLRRDLVSAQANATIDALTGLYNRWHLVTRLREETATATRHDKPYAVVMLDLDHFKSVNDTHGHAEGDRVLMHVADGVRSVLRGDDVAFRYGGEEFLLLLRACDADQAARVAARLRDWLDARPLTMGNGETLRVTFSGGIAVASAARGFISDELIERADSALYRAKRAGRNRVDLDG